jgi:HlyD family secretion protein
VNGDVAERVAIQIGATSMREIEILGGLNEGDEIVISNYEKFNQAPSVLLR